MLPGNERWFIDSWYIPTWFTVNYVDSKGDVYGVTSRGSFVRVPSLRVYATLTECENVLRPPKKTAKQWELN